MRSWKASARRDQSVVDLIEDEILLALPLAPKHDVCASDGRVLGCCWQTQSVCRVAAVESHRAGRPGLILILVRSHTNGSSTE